MLEFIIWLIGAILTIKAALQIWNMEGDTMKRLVFIVLLLITSWLGLVLYYVFLKNSIAKWVK
ncbi:MAG: hypothetical protein IJ467_07290 [Bacteroidaceae bacterium]|nr:hypothetical protein [Bacteroidaceae bacterium]